MGSVMDEEECWVGWFVHCYRSGMYGWMEWPGGFVSRVFGIWFGWLVCFTLGVYYTEYSCEYSGDHQLGMGYVDPWSLKYFMLIEPADGYHHLHRCSHMGPKEIDASLISNCKFSHWHICSPRFDTDNWTGELAFRSPFHCYHDIRSYIDPCIIPPHRNI